MELSGFFRMSKFSHCGLIQSSSVCGYLKPDASTSLNKSEPSVGTGLYVYKTISVLGLISFTFFMKSDIKINLCHYFFGRRSRCTQYK